jgi:DNA-directed RNA polymerase sigma subunit (sigma70/sigma32)
MNTATTTTSRDECVSNDIARRNECIMVALDHAGAMIRRFAFSYQLDFEELYQDCAVEMLDARMPDDCDPIAYLYGIARMRCREILAKTEWTVSLDQPRYEDGKKTLADTLQAHEQRRTEAELDYLDKVTEVVYAALRECRTEEQEYARRVYGLVNYTPVANEKLAYHSKQVKQERHVRSIRRSVQGVFRKHPQVQALVQRETCAM